MLWGFAKDVHADVHVHVAILSRAVSHADLRLLLFLDGGCPLDLVLVLKRAVPIDDLRAPARAGSAGAPLALRTVRTFRKSQMSDASVAPISGPTHQIQWSSQESATCHGGAID